MEAGENLDLPLCISPTVINKIRTSRSLCLCGKYPSVPSVFSSAPLPGAPELVLKRVYERQPAGLDDIIGNAYGAPIIMVIR